MAKGVSAKNYQASEAEKANAEVGMSEYQRFKQAYAPVLKNQMVRTQTDDASKVARRTANADAMQATTKDLSLGKVENPNYPGAVADVVTGQLGVANKAARQYQNEQGANVLARARQQVGTAQEGMSMLSRLGTSEALTRARAKEEVAQAKINAATQIGSTLVSTGMENLSQKDINGKSSFWAPGILDEKATSPDGKPVYKTAASWEDRLSAGLGRSF